MVLVPIAAMSLSTRWREPSPNATIDTTEAMPMMMPSMVSSVRRRCPAIARKAMVKASLRRPSKAAHDASGCAAGRAAARLTGSAPSVRRSAMRRPSATSMMRCACAATLASWVTMMTVWPSACSSLRMRMTSSPLTLSSAPVGSSARMTSPPFISARAIDTRCCCPPESWPGRCSARSSRPSRLSKASARSWRRAGLCPA